MNLESLLLCNSSLKARLLLLPKVERAFRVVGGAAIGEVAEGYISVSIDKKGDGIYVRTGIEFSVGTLKQGDEEPTKYHARKTCRAIALASSDVVASSQVSTHMESFDDPYDYTYPGGVCCDKMRIILGFYSPQLPPTYNEIVAVHIAYDLDAISKDRIAEIAQKGGNTALLVHARSRLGLSI